MKKRIFILLLAMAMIIASFSGCSGKETDPDSAVDTSTPVLLRVVGPWEDFSGIEAVADMFIDDYPNCTLEYEYLQDYYASLEKRLASQEDTIDLFITTNIKPDTEQSKLMPYALDLYDSSIIDLSSTFEGLIRNFEYSGTEPGVEPVLYAIPIGAEVRGMYANVTLLNSLGLSVPTNLDELLSACAVLADNGYVPMQGNPGSFAQQLMYPYICNLISNSDDYETLYNRINSREAGLSEIFREPMSVLYNLVENRYYNYKHVENEFGTFTDASNEGYARNFLNIAKTGDEYAKVDDLGTVAFMPSTVSLGSTIEKFKSDYHSNIEFEFILSPVSQNGGFAYMSPAHGIAINKLSPQLEWAERFLNFMFTSEVSKVFAEKQSLIPNSNDAFLWISEHFNVPQSNISHLGTVSFNYSFYSLICSSLVEVSKANNPKYMTTDSSGAEVLYGLDYYLDRLDKRLTGELTD